MNEIERWFQEASKVTRIFTLVDRSFLIYKGFKITKGEFRDYMLQDTRFSNMYSPVSDEDYKTFTSLGFIKGADNIGFARDTKRVETYKKRTGILYDKRKIFKDELPKNKRLNEKRIRNINRKVEEYIDLIFYYQTRVKQFNFKYNNNE